MSNVSVGFLKEQLTDYFVAAFDDETIAYSVLFACTETAVGGESTVLCQKKAERFSPSADSEGGTCSERRSANSLAQPLSKRMYGRGKVLRGFSDI